MKAKGGNEALQRARLPWPLQRGVGNKGVAEGSAGAPHRARHSWKQPQERWICANQGTSKHSRGTVQLLPWLDSAIGPGDQPRNGQSHGEGIKAASQREAARALGSLSRSAAPGEGKEVASGISGQSPLLPNIVRYRASLLGSGP